MTFKGGGGRVTGVIYDDDGVTPLTARVSVSGLRVQTAGGKVGTGFAFTQHLRIVDNDFTTGKFSFNNLFVGPIVITAAGPFSPDPVTFSGEVPYAGATVDVRLQLQPTSQIKGTVFQPDGFTPVGKDVAIKFKSEEFIIICNGEDCQAIPQGIQEEIVVTDDYGRFWLPIVNAGKFTLTAIENLDDPEAGRQGQVSGTIQAGQTGEVSIRLVGLGDVTVQVYRSDGHTPVPGARVDLEQTGFPRLKRTGIAGDGTITFSGGDALPEGPLLFGPGPAEWLCRQGIREGDKRWGTGDRQGLSTMPSAPSTGLSIAITGSPLSQCRVHIFNSSGDLAFAVTDDLGQYRQDFIPLGVFSVEVFEAATGRRGANSGRIDLADQEVPVNIVESAIGQVSGMVFASGDLSPLKGWEVTLSQPLAWGSVTMRGTTGIDGGFSFPGVSIGTFSLDVSKQGLGSAHADGRITREGRSWISPWWSISSNRQRGGSRMGLSTGWHTGG